jgi:rubrerythrin
VIAFGLKEPQDPKRADRQRGAGEAAQSRSNHPTAPQGTETSQGPSPNAQQDRPGPPAEKGPTSEESATPRENPNKDEEKPGSRDRKGSDSSVPDKPDQVTSDQEQVSQEISQLEEWQAKWDALFGDEPSKERYEQYQEQARANWHGKNFSGVAILMSIQNNCVQLQLREDEPVTFFAEVASAKGLKPLLRKLVVIEGTFEFEIMSLAKASKARHRLWRLKNATVIAITPNGVLGTRHRKSLEVFLTKAIARQKAFISRLKEEVERRLKELRGEEQKRAIEHYKRIERHHQDLLRSFQDQQKRQLPHRYQK